MASLLLVADALARVLNGVEPLPSENAPLVEAEGRVLTADVAAAQGRSALEVLVSLTGRAAYEYSGDEGTPAGSTAS